MLNTVACYDFFMTVFVFIIRPEVFDLERGKISPQHRPFRAIIGNLSLKSCIRTGIEYNRNQVMNITHIIGSSIETNVLPSQEMQISSSFPKSRGISRDVPNCQHSSTKIRNSPEHPGQPGTASWHQNTPS